MPSGIIVIDKPQGLTSNATLQRVRKAYKAKSAGHVGTLDPMATGMLPICLDEATKVIADVEAGAKCYEFTLQLGARTDTGDAEGAVVETRPVPALDRDAVEQLLRAFVGTQQQVPPMYSALKRQGRPLYELARQGIEVERAARTIDIPRLELLSLRPDALYLVCECTKGTYVRVLGEDIARRAGTVGHLTRLRRLWVEPFQELAMHSLEAALATAGPEGQNLLRADAPLQGLPQARLTAAQVTAVRNGQATSTGTDPAAIVGQRVRLYGPEGEFLGLGECQDGALVQPRRLFRTDAT